MWNFNDVCDLFGLALSNHIVNFNHRSLCEMHQHNTVVDDDQWITTDFLSGLA